MSLQGSVQKDAPAIGRTVTAMMPDSQDKRFDTHRASVHVWAYRILGNHEDAADVTQEVFLKWWRAHREEPSPDNPVGWLRRVTINQSISVLRRGKRRESPAGPVVEAIAAGEDVPAIERNEIAAAVTAALEDITEQQREVLVAKVYDGCTFAAIAHQMQLAIPTIKTHYLRALKAVRGRLMAAGIVEGAET